MHTEGNTGYCENVPEIWAEYGTKVVYSHQDILTFRGIAELCYIQKKKKNQASSKCISIMFKKE